MSTRTLAAACAALAATAVVAAPAGAHGAHHHHGSRGANAHDRSWLREAAAGDRFEIQGGTAAQAKAARAEVKAFGQRLVQDHTAHLAAVQAVARRLHVALPSAPRPEQQKILALGGTLPAGTFDCFFLATEWADHEADIASAKLELAKGRSRAVRILAARSLGTYHAHEQMASDLLLSQQGCAAS